MSVTFPSAGCFCLTWLLVLCWQELSEEAVSRQRAEWFSTQQTDTQRRPTKRWNIKNNPNADMGWLRFSRGDDLKEKHQYHGVNAAKLMSLGTVYFDHDTWNFKR